MALAVLPLIHSPLIRQKQTAVAADAAEAVDPTDSISPPTPCLALLERLEAASPRLVAARAMVKQAVALKGTSADTGLATTSWLENCL
jgi:hypothetical protein